MSSSDLLPGKISDTNTGSRSGEIAIRPFPVLCPLYFDRVQLCCMICEGFSIKISVQSIIRLVVIKGYESAFDAVTLVQIP